MFIENIGGFSRERLPVFFCGKVPDMPDERLPDRDRDMEKRIKQNSFPGCLNIYYGENMTRQQEMKKRRWWLAAATALGILAVWLGNTEEQIKETGRTAVRFIAGEGMIRLMEQTMDHPKVALTFDDGPSKKYTPKLLDGLKERGVHASFFLLGKNIEGNEELVKRIQKEGHLVGNHTYSHVQLNKLTEAKIQEEIVKTSNQIYEITGVYPQYLRPPFGSWKKNMEIFVEMFPVFWTIDTLDWETKNVPSILNIVEKQVEDGSIILMHDGYATSVEAALKIVDDLRKDGYEFVTVDEFLLP